MCSFRSSRAGRARLLLTVSLGALALACAEGTAIPDLNSQALPALPAPDAGPPMTVPDAGADPGFIGDPCAMGETMACTCDDGGAGMRTCMADPSSPTGGALGPCGMCQPPVVMDPPDAGGGSAGGTSEPPPMTTDPPARTCEVSACPMATSPIPLLPPPVVCCTDMGTCGEEFLGNCI